MSTERRPKEQGDVVSRRRFLRHLGVVACVGTLPLLSIGCERHRYIRPAGELDLGPVKDLLYDVSHKREASVLVFRDIDGWSALSLRCTYRGCDLTYQEPVVGEALLLCPCCRTRYRLTGEPYEGWPATRPLPWLDITYRDGHLYAEPGRPRDRKFRFTTPEIEEAIRELRRRIKDQEVSDNVVVPEVLMGMGDGEAGGMFLEDDPNLIYELDMIK